MRQHLAALGLVVVGGCSWIYNPDKIAVKDGGADAPVDTEIVTDADPTMLDIVDIFPSAIDEGTGTAGQRPGVVVISGKNFVDDARVTLSDGVMVTATRVARDHNFLVAEIVAPIRMPSSEGTIALTVTVTQNGNANSKTIDAGDPRHLALNTHEKLTVAPTSSDGLKPMYSQIAITGNVTFAAGAHNRAVLRSASTIAITGNVVVDASGQNPGPGGCKGGGATSQGAGTSNDGVTCGGRGGGTGTALLGNAGGGGAGFVTMGDQGGNGGGMGGNPVGDSRIPSFASNVASGGGGGQNALSSTGGVGGGGGGTVELTAAGDVTVGAISANGGDGGGPMGLGGGGGGAGAGGVILIRAGGSATFGALSVAKGKVGSPNGGGASDGRIRVDSATGMQSGYAGPMFVAPPTFVTTQMTNIALRGMPSTSDATLRVYDKAGNVVSMVAPTFGTMGTATPSIKLTAGYNHVCVTVAGAALELEGNNCIDIAFLP